MRKDEDEYELNVSIRSAGGNASKNSIRGSLNIPKDILKDMELTKEDCSVLLVYEPDSKEFRVKKLSKNSIK